MPSIPELRDKGPHVPLPVEATWNEFVQSFGGRRVSDMLGKSPEFENTDFLFEQDQVVGELKKVKQNLENPTPFTVDSKA